MKFATIGLHSGGKEIEVIMTKASEHLIEGITQVVRKNVRIIFNIREWCTTEDTETIEKFMLAYSEKLQEEGYNICIRGIIEWFPKLREAGIDFMPIAPINNMETVKYLCESGYKEIEVASPLTFNIAEVSKLIHSYDALVRVNAVFPYSPTSKIVPESFFVLPQHATLYDPYVDYMALYNPYQPSDTKNDFKNQETVLDIYSKGEWHGTIQDIIEFPNEEAIFCDCIPDLFVRRIYCNHRCDYNLCDGCRDCFDIAKKMREAGLSIRS